MFAVPGWSVPCQLLRTQKEGELRTEVAAKGNNDKKRKRSNSKSGGFNPADIGDLWERVIEGKPKNKKRKKKKKIVKGWLDGELGEQDSVESQDDNDGTTGKRAQRKSTSIQDKNSKDIGLKKAQHLELGREVEKEVEGESMEVKSMEESERARLKNRMKKNNEQKSKDLLKPTEMISGAKPDPKSSTAPGPKNNTKLTPLQASMRQKLISARFRHLNQTLYTSPSKQSFTFFQENPEMFKEYHEGFRQQVEVWPENPVDGYIAQIKTRGATKGFARGKMVDRETPTAVKALPRSSGICHIADLGCGDAAISAALQSHTQKFHLQIHSFDLQSPSRLVTKADISNLPLADGSVDVAIFCLALMGTNWIDFIEEAFRILRWKGELWIAEIKSRFGRVEKGSSSSGRGVVKHSVGSRRRLGENAKETKRSEEDDAVATIEIDSSDDRPAETDVRAFTEVLCKRGFMLSANDAIDFRNKMFVKMSFTKSLTPIKGKCVALPNGLNRFDSTSKTDRDKPTVCSEAVVLKPCVYKLR